MTPCRLCGSTTVPLGWDICQPCDKAETIRIKSEAVVQATEIIRESAKDMYVLEALRAILSPPKTKAEAASYLLAVLQVKDLKEMRACSKDDLIQYHHGFGRWIRNHLGFWDEAGSANDLIAECCGDGELHPDAASMAIIETMWETLQTIDLPEETPT